MIWQVIGIYADALDIPHSSTKHDLDHGAEITLTLNHCTRYHLIAIDRNAAANANRDPYGDAVEVASLRYWERYMTGLINGEQLTETIF